MSKSIWILLCVWLVGCLAIPENNNNVEPYSIASQIEDALKSTLSEIQTKLVQYDTDDIKVDPLTIENVGTLTVKKLGLEGISKFKYDVKAKMQGIKKVTLDFSVGWDSTPFHLVLDHVMHVENAKFGWLDGPGGIDFTVKDTSLGLHLTLVYLKPDISEVTITVGPETRFAKFKLGGADLKETMNDLFTNEDIHTIVTILLGELIKEVAGSLVRSSKSANIDIAEFFVAKAKDPAFTKHAITLMDRLYKM